MKNSYNNTAYKKTKHLKFTNIFFFKPLEVLYEKSTPYSELQRQTKQNF